MQRKGSSSKTDHKQGKSWKKTCILILISTANGQTLKPAVVGKGDEFGQDELGYYKLKSLREWAIPGLGRLGDFLEINSNASGFFDAQTYSKLVLHGVIPPYAKTRGIAHWMRMLHDAATTHKVQRKKKGGEVEHFHVDAAGSPMAHSQWTWKIGLRFAG